MTYKLKDVLNIVRNNTSTLDELNGKSLNDLFTNAFLINQLNMALSIYSDSTKAIEDFYSLPFSATEFIQAPPLALRSESYRYAIIWLLNVKYIIDATDINRLNNVFRYQTLSGTPRWFLGWKDKIYINPVNQQGYKTTTLATAISYNDTTITLTDASSFISYQGRITIDDEKILYSYRMGNTFYECERGIEQTTPANHSALATVNENNLWIFYRRLHEIFSVNSNDSIDASQLNKIMEIPDEHIKVLTDYVSYMVLQKIDPMRAASYKIDFEKWISEIAIKVQHGRAITKKTGMIRDEFLSESDYSFPYSLYGM